MNHAKWQEAEHLLQGNGMAEVLISFTEIFLEFGKQTAPMSQTSSWTFVVQAETNSSDKPFSFAAFL